MKSIFSIFIFLLFISCQFRRATNSLVFKENLITPRQSEIIFKRTENFPNDTQVSIAIIQNGDTKFCGIAKIRDTVFQSDNQSKVFEIASISKVFTSTLLANAVIEGKVKLDDPITAYLDFTLKNNTQITLKQLANHTSGLPRIPNNTGISFNRNTRFRDYDESKLKEYLTKDLHLLYQPGEETSYSNLGVGLLGYVLTQIENEGYESLVQNKIFNRYQMHRSTSNRRIIDEFLVRGQNSLGFEVTNLDLGVLVGGGGILSTVEDLSKFVVAHFDSSNKELELTRKKTFKINQSDDRALSWRIIKIDSSQALHFHNGATEGYKSFLAMDVERKIGIVILSNVSGLNRKSGEIDMLGFELMETLL